MKKLILGCSLMLCGTIAGTGWLMAYASLVEPSAWSSMTNLFPIMGFGRLDGYIVLAFYALAVVGAVMAIKAVRADP